jgi:glucokinase
MGGTNTKAGVCDCNGRVLTKLSIATEAEQGPEHVMDRIARAARLAIDKAGLGVNDVLAVGVGAPGTIDFDAGVVTIAPNLPGWHDIYLREGVAERLNIRTIIENDANAAAYGEYWAGAGAKADPLVFFTLGTGVGGGIIIGGNVIHGSSGAGGELGHLIIRFGDGRQCACGNRGCLEAYASATAIVGRFADAVTEGSESALADKVRAGDEVTSADIHGAAVAGDALAAHIMEETGELLGYGIVSIVHALNPERVVLGGGVIAAGDMLLGPVRRTVKEMVFPLAQKHLQVVFATLGGDAGFIGTAGCALQKSVTSA